MFYCPDPNCPGHKILGDACTPRLRFCGQAKCPGHYDYRNCLPALHFCGKKSCPGHQDILEHCLD